VEPVKVPEDGASPNATTPSTAKRRRLRAIG
jgi:hypothetical protein